jgi:hypothetical protein
MASTKHNRLAILTVVLGLLALLVPFAADAAAAGRGFEPQKFKVEIKGVQKMVQQRTHAAEGECDVSDFSSGSEKIVFKTKPIVILAAHAPGQFNPFLLSKSEVGGGIPATARITRSYTPRISSPEGGPKCGENGGGSEGEELKPDCGTRTVTPWILRFDYSEEHHDKVKLGADEGEDPFEDCPGAGTLSFPFLLDEDSNEQGIYAELSQDELFDKSIGKWITIGKGSRKYQGDDYWSKATVEWDASFTRIH